MLNDKSCHAFVMMGGIVCSTTDLFTEQVALID